MMPLRGLVLGGSLLLAVGVFARTVLLVVTVENRSMLPTLAEGDRVLVARHWPTRRLRKGHIVLVWPWGRPTAGAGPSRDHPYIKRLVGLPGETIVTSITELDQVNRAREAAAHDSQGRRVWHVPAGHCFVRGDHPIGGFDSLSWGPVPMRHVLGVVIKTLPRKASRERTGAAIAASATAASLVGHAAPDFKAEKLGGGVVTRADYAGRAAGFLFVTPSDLCRDAIRGYEATRLRAAQDGVEFVLVSVVDMMSTRICIAELGIGSPIVVAPRGTNPFARDYQIPGTPFFCLVDAQGTITSTGHTTATVGGQEGHRPVPVEAGP